MRNNSGKYRKYPCKKLPKTFKTKLIQEIPDPDQILLDKGICPKCNLNLDSQFCFSCKTVYGKAI